MNWLDPVTADDPRVAAWCRRLNYACVGLAILAGVLAVILLVTQHGRTTLGW